MKHLIINCVAFVALCFVVSACKNGSNGSQQETGKRFAPEERTSSMTTQDRENAIAQKQSEQVVDFETLINSNGIRLSILQPIVAGDITQSVSDRLCMRMLEIASQNGISGMGGNPNFVLGVEINQTGRSATGSAPQRMTVQYEMLFKVMNAITGDVYGTAKQEVVGVGRSFEEATVNAANDIKNTAGIQEFLNSSSKRIIDWYNNNVSVIKNEVDKAEAQGDYAYALALLCSVPEQASSAYQYATQKQPSTLSGMLHKQATDMLGEMEGLIASLGDEFNPSVGAYFSLIPNDSPEYKTAQTLYAEYEKKCNARRSSLEAKAERDEQAARELEKIKMLYDHETDLTQKEVDKVKYQAQAQASAAAARSKPTGFFGSLGYAITSFTDVLLGGNK